MNSGRHSTKDETDDFMSKSEEDTLKNYIDHSAMKDIALLYPNIFGDSDQKHKEKQEFIPQKKQNFSKTQAIWSMPQKL